MCRWRSRGGGGAGDVEGGAGSPAGAGGGGGVNAHPRSRHHAHHALLAHSDLLLLLFLPSFRRAGCAIATPVSWDDGALVLFNRHLVLFSPLIPLDC